MLQQSNPLIEAVCKYCDGMGIVQVTDPTIAVGQPGYARTVACKHCEKGKALHQRQMTHLFASSEMPDIHQNMMLKQFQSLVEERKMGKVLAIGAAELFVEKRGQPFTGRQIFQRIGYDAIHQDIGRFSLVFCGDYGVGKTSLALAIGNELIQAGCEVLFVRTLALIKRVQQGYRGNGGKDVTQMAQTCQILILDECNLRQYTPDRIEILEEIIYERDNHKLPYVLTVNTTQTAFEEGWGPFIAARVANNAHWIKMGGVVLRQEGGVLEDPTDPHA